MKPKTLSPADAMRALLELKQQALRLKQSEKSANKLADRQNRWQSFNRFTWDKRRG